MIPIIQNSFISGELAPSFLGRTDKPQYRNGASTMRNMFVRYTGGAYSRAGFAYCGMCKQGAPNAGGTATSNPPRLINFQFSINQGFALEFGDQYMRILSNGAYVVEAAKSVTAITQANPGIITIPTHGFSNGDWIFASGIGGMTNFNGLTWIVQNSTTNTFTLTDLFGTVVNTSTFSAFTSGGTFARIYTVVSPYAAIDLPYLKVTESANTMNLTCWNQQTNTEYPPYTLQRISNTNWMFTQVSFAIPVLPPTTVSATAQNSTTKSTWYSYEITAIDSNGNESAASSAVNIFNNDISVNAGSNTVTWNSAGSNISNYNIYAATPAYSTGTFSGFIGVPYGLVGTAFGLQFIDTNIIPDFTQSPPTHENPFARGKILEVTPTSAGSGLSQTGTGIVFNTSTGSGASVQLIIQNSQLAGIIIQDEGQNYALTDTATISGIGSGAAVSLMVGPETGTYPGTCQYYQQRLVYANTINEPDTYFMSQPGLYNNFDSAIPVVDSDAITGTPWGLQINGIQFFVPSIQGLLAFTGNGVWLINGGNNVAITPSDQNAQAQAQVGCSALLPPLYVNLHVLYVQAKNSVVRDISFNFLYNTFIGSDITLYSSHLFLGYTLSQWAYAEEPFKIIWLVRNDGTILSLTYIKDQEIQGWARHDTNGLFISVCSVIEPPINEDVSFSLEPPIDAIYAITKRYIVGQKQWVYYSERANNRIWQNVEDCFCVDAGLFYPLTYPNAMLSPSTVISPNSIGGTKVISGGGLYVNPTATAVDSTGSGFGAGFSVTTINGVITAISPSPQGEDYTAGETNIIITDNPGFISYVYASNSSDNTVSVINTLNGSVAATISVGSNPAFLAITPDGTQVWVCNSGTNTVSVINATSLTVIATITVGAAVIGIAFTPNGATAYVTDSLSNVYPVTVSSRTVGSAIPVGNFPEGICITPDGLKGYVANRNDGTVSVITIASNTVTNTITVGSFPFSLAATPNSALVYVSNFNDGTVSVINTGSGTVINTITVGNNPQGIVSSPNGLSIYVANSGDNTVSVISTVSQAVISTINIGNGVKAISATPDGKSIYTAGGNVGAISIIDIATNTITQPSTIGSQPFGMASSGLIASAATGTGAVAQPIIVNNVTLTASSSVFNANMVGDIIRVDGGIGTITGYTSSTVITANFTSLITQVIPNDPNNLPVQAISGTWSIGIPVTVISGLNHLEGMEVTGLADGGVIVPQIVQNGTITLQTPATVINVGLPYTAQLQTMYLETPAQTTTQGKRKDIQAVTVRLDFSRGVKVGTNQPDASVQPNQANVPWSNLKEIKERNNLITAGNSTPLFTGDHRILVPGNWTTNGQVAFEQDYPLPLGVIACIPEVTIGDASA